MKKLRSCPATGMELIFDSNKHLISGVDALEVMVWCALNAGY